MDIIAQTFPKLAVRKDYDIKEAAAALRVSTKTIRRLINKRLLRRSSKLGRIRIPAADVDNFFDDV